MPVVVGVLALQGAFDAHAHCLHEVGADAREIRTPENLAKVDALVLPGGESSTMSMLLQSTGLFDAIQNRIADGMPIFGTCAGLILLATQVLDGRADQRSFGALNISVRRNAYGRQVDSFEDTVTTSVGPFHGVFIRAPRIENVDHGVDVLGSHNGEPVLVRQGNAIGCSFHPELAGDSALHRYFVDDVVVPYLALSIDHQKG